MQLIYMIKIQKFKTIHLRIQYLISNYFLPSAKEYKKLLSAYDSSTYLFLPIHLVLNTHFSFRPFDVLKSYFNNFLNIFFSLCQISISKIELQYYVFYLILLTCTDKIKYKEKILDEYQHLPDLYTNKKIIQYIHYQIILQLSAIDYTNMSLIAKLKSFPDDIRLLTNDLTFDFS